MQAKQTATAANNFDSQGVNRFPAGIHICTKEMLWSETSDKLLDIVVSHLKDVLKAAVHSAMVPNYPHACICLQVQCRYKSLSRPVRTAIMSWFSFLVAN